MVVSFAASELDLIKTSFTTLSFDTDPEFVLRASCYLICTLRADIFAILREVAIQGVAVAVRPTFDELLLVIEYSAIIILPLNFLDELVASKECVLSAIAPRSLVLNFRIAFFLYAVKMGHPRIVGPDQLDD